MVPKNKHHHNSPVRCCKMDVLLLRTEEGYVKHLGDVSSLELTLIGGRKSTLLRTTKKRGLSPFRLTNEMPVDTNKDLFVRIRSREEGGAGNRDRCVEYPVDESHRRDSGLRRGGGQDRGADLGSGHLFVDRDFVR